MVLDAGGGSPGGAVRPGGTTGERPGGIAGRPGGATGTSFDAEGGGDRGDATSCGADADPASESTATEPVGERGTGGGGGTDAVSFALEDLAVAGVIGRFGSDAGVAGREDEACEEDFIAALFFRTSVIAGADGVVVEPERCDLPNVAAVRRACLVLWLAALVLLCSAVLAKVVLLLLAHEAARGSPRHQTVRKSACMCDAQLTFSLIALLDRGGTSSFRVLHCVFPASVLETSYL